MDDILYISWMHAFVFFRLLYYNKDATNLLAFPDSSHTHTAANAHGGASNSLVLTLKFREESGNLAGTSAAERMAQSDGTTLGVDLLDGDVQLLNSVDSLGGESFIQLKDVNIIKLKTGTFDSNRDSESRSNTHNIGRNLCG